MNKGNSRIEMTQEELDTLLETVTTRAASVAAQTVIESFRKQEKGKKDRRLHNAKLLLNNYRMLKKNCAEAVYQKNHSEDEPIDIKELMEEMLTTDDSDSVIVESIKRSAQRTNLMLEHIDKMIEVYRIYCSKCSDREKRQYKVLKAIYFLEKKVPIQELADKFHVSRVTIYDDKKIAEERIASLLFGIDGLHFE